MAEAIGCAKSTISRELKRGTVTQMKTGRATFEAYFPETGQLKYEENRQACGANLKLDDAIEFIQYTETKILDDHWSPDAVCGSATLHEQFEGKRVCTKTLYNYIELGYIGGQKHRPPDESAAEYKKAADPSEQARAWPQ
ncbi:integrase catalytic subunit, partial [Planococcus antarcticus DSM 14505]